MKNIKLANFIVPITESAEIDNNFIIKGIAISETTTANGHKFIAEELRPAAKGMNGIPLLKDHVNEVDSIMGKVIGSEFSESNRAINFSARVSDKSMIKLIKSGNLNTVSIGAMVRELEETKSGDLIARGIIIKELSLVAVPADSNATFTKAIWEAYNGKHKVPTKTLLNHKIKLQNQSNTNQIRERAIKKVKEAELLKAYNLRIGRTPEQRQAKQDNLIDSAINNFGLQNTYDINSHNDKTTKTNKMKQIKTKQTKTSKGLIYEEHPFKTGVSINQTGFNPKSKFNLVNAAIKDMLNRHPISVNEKNIFGQGALTMKQGISEQEQMVKHAIKVEAECKRLRSNGVFISKQKVREISKRLLRG